MQSQAETSVRRDTLSKRISCMVMFMRHVVITQNMVLVLNEINMLWYVTLNFIIQFMFERVIQWLFLSASGIGCEKYQICVLLCVLFVWYFAQPHTKYNIFIVDFQFEVKVDGVKLLYFRVYGWMCPIYCWLITQQHQDSTCILHSSSNNNNNHYYTTCLLFKRIYQQILKMFVPIKFDLFCDQNITVTKRMHSLSQTTLNESYNLENQFYVQKISSRLSKFLFSFFFHGTHRHTRAYFPNSGRNLFQHPTHILINNAFFHY